MIGSLKLSGPARVVRSRERKMFGQGAGEGCWGPTDSFPYADPGIPKTPLQTEGQRIAAAMVVHWGTCVVFQNRSDFVYVNPLSVEEVRRIVAEAIDGAVAKAVDRNDEKWAEASVFAAERLSGTHRKSNRRE